MRQFLANIGRRLGDKFQTPGTLSRWWPIFGIRSSNIGRCWPTLAQLCPTSTKFRLRFGPLSAKPDSAAMTRSSHRPTAPEPRPRYEQKQASKPSSRQRYRPHLSRMTAPGATSGQAWGSFWAASEFDGISGRSCLGRMGSIPAEFALSGRRHSNLICELTSHISQPPMGPHLRWESVARLVDFLSQTCAGVVRAG